MLSDVHESTIIFRITSLSSHKWYWSGQEDSSQLSLFCCSEACKGYETVQACKWHLTGHLMQGYFEREKTKLLLSGITWETTVWSQPLIIWLMRKLDSNKLVIKISGACALLLPSVLQQNSRHRTICCNVNHMHKCIGELTKVMMWRQKDTSLPCLGREFSTRFPALPFTLFLCLLPSSLVAFERIIRFPD